MLLRGFFSLVGAFLLFNQALAAPIYWDGDFNNVTPEDVPVSGTLILYDEFGDPSQGLDLANLQFFLISPPELGTVTIDNGSFSSMGAIVYTYIPTSNYYNNYPGIPTISPFEFVIVYDDSTGSTGQQVLTQVSIVVDNVPDALFFTPSPPIFSTQEDNLLVRSLGVTDEDGLNANSYSIVAAPSNGTVDISLISESFDSFDFDYVPNPNFNGSDSFGVAVTDDTGQTETITVSINVDPVSDAPSPQDDVVFDIVNNSIAIDVLSNDFDIDGDSLTISSVTTPASGIASINAELIDYSPNTNFVGVDFFDYTVNDGNSDVVANITVVVTEDPDSDNDGLPDSLENVLGTDPTNPNSNADADNLLDSQELSWFQKGPDLVGDSQNIVSGADLASSESGNIVAIGEPYFDDPGTGLTQDNRGRVKVIEWNGSNWLPIGSPIAGPASGDQFGRSVSLSDDGLTLAVGAPYGDIDGGVQSTGDVRVYRWNGEISEWEQLGGDIDGEKGNDQTGAVVSLDGGGTRLAVGDGYYDFTTFNSDDGRVRIFDYNSATNSWDAVGSAIYGAAANDHFGFSALHLSDDGTTVAVGAYENDENRGQTRIYRLKDIGSGSCTEPVLDISTLEWCQIGQDITAETAGEKLGSSVALSSSGDSLVIGIPGTGFALGQVRIYTYVEDIDQWGQRGAAIDGEAISPDGFSAWAYGKKVAISDDGNVVIAAASTPKPYARSFAWDGLTWNELGNAVKTSAQSDNNFQGLAISSDGSQIAISAPQNNSFEGLVRVFKLNAQESVDTDGDGTGDNADLDDDNDGIDDAADDFPLDPAASVDTDVDGLPDDWNAGFSAADSTTGLTIDTDDDNDYLPDLVEEPTAGFNPLGTDPLIADTDGDGTDDWEEDFDLDGIVNYDELFFPPSGDRTNPSLEDSDGDGVIDGIDAFPLDPEETTDSDGDGVGDNADAFPDDIAASIDTDGDGLPDDWNAGFSASAGLALDDDDDGDGVPDVSDAFPLNAGASVIEPNEITQNNPWVPDFLPLDLVFFEPNLFEGSSDINDHPTFPIAKFQVGATLHLEYMNVNDQVTPAVSGNYFANHLGSAPIFEWYLSEGTEQLEILFEDGSANISETLFVPIGVFEKTIEDSDVFLSKSQIDILIETEGLGDIEVREQISRMVLTRVESLGDPSVPGECACDRYIIQYDKTWTIVDPNYSYLLLGEGAGPINMYSLSSEFEIELIDVKQETLNNAETIVDDAGLPFGGSHALDIFIGEVTGSPSWFGYNRIEADTALFNSDGTGSLLDHTYSDSDLPYEFDWAIDTTDGVTLAIDMAPDANSPENIAEIRYTQFASHGTGQTTLYMTALYQGEHFAQLVYGVPDTFGGPNPEIETAISELLAPDKLLVGAWLPTNPDYYVKDGQGNDVIDLEAVYGFAFSTADDPDAEAYWGRQVTRYWDLQNLPLDTTTFRWAVTDGLLTISGKFDTSVGAFADCIVDNSTCFASFSRTWRVLDYDVEAHRIYVIEKQIGYMEELGGWGTQITPQVTYYEVFDQDQDGDNISDFAERLQLGLDPYTPTDADSDGITVGDRYPFDAEFAGDSDLDGIDDAYETNFGSDITDPTLDTDNDGLDIRAEYAGGTSDLVANKTQQIIATSPGLRPLTASRIRFTYDVSDSRNDLTGMGLRIHFHEKDFSLFNIEVNTPYEAGLFEINNAWSFDEKNYDGDFHTNRYVSIEWTNQDGPWPGTPLPLEAFSVIAAPKPFYAFGEEAIVNFSAFSLAPGYGLLAPRLQLTKRLSAMLDVDADGEIEALTDGLIVLRWLFGYSDVTAGTLSFESPYYDFPSDLLPALQSQEDLFDVDGDGQASAFTDGVLLLRYLFGYRGDALITGAIGANATRKTATDIENRLNVMSEL